jgi:dCTP deaminase
LSPKPHPDYEILDLIENFKPETLQFDAVAEALGELRIHYAGFVHPRFGEARDDDKGAPLIFEVRGHNIRAFLQDGEALAKLEYYYMSQDASKYSCTYNEQELTLSKFFKEEVEEDA